MSQLGPVRLSGPPSPVSAPVRPRRLARPRARPRQWPPQRTASFGPLRTPVRPVQCPRDNPSEGAKSRHLLTPVPSDACAERHRGTLFLDELGEFPPHALDAL